MITDTRKLKYNLVGQRFTRLVVKGLSEKRVFGGVVWDCKCDCGNEVEAAQSNLIKRITKSCGCLTTEKRRNRTIKPFGESTKNFAYIRYKYGASKRGLEFSLTFEECMAMFSSNCFYCNAEPSNVIKSNYNNGDFIYNGIDRVDNNLGYVASNVVPCCKQCNNAKWILSKDEFLKLIKRIFEYKCL